MTSVWSFPNMHGDIVVTTDASGTRQGALAQYDPFGDAIDPATGDIGTKVADDAVADNTTAPGESFAWERSQQKQQGPLSGSLTRRLAPVERDR